MSAKIESITIHGTTDLSYRLVITTQVIYFAQTANWILVYQIYVFILKLCFCYLQAL